MPLPGGIRDYVCMCDVVVTRDVDDVCVMGQVEAVDVAKHLSVAICCDFSALLPFVRQIKYLSVLLGSPSNRIDSCPRWCVIISARGVTSCDLILDINAGRSFFVHTYEVEMSM
jgi:hypothetical protein